ncbi:MAG: NADH-quinone oxidoreductase subunit N [Fimbriiglobus sp.]|nr:NADH-quinone oxidoreductase subunit N [Fimbriiglobus sp.]
MIPLTLPNFTDHLKASIGYVLPEVTLVAAACLLFLLACVRGGRAVSFVIALLGVASAGTVAWFVPEGVVPRAGEAAANAFNPAFAPIDPTGAASFIRWMALVAAAVYVFLGWTDCKTAPPEYYACWLVVAAGLSLVGRSNDLVTLFLSLEMVSIPTYVLLYLPAVGKTGQESAMKYFMLSVLSSAVLLFGFSYLYGITGSTNLHAIIAALTRTGTTDGSQPLLAVVGGVMVLGGLGFRVAAVPFHFYAPDVYEAGPTGVVGQLAFVPKVAGFVALARLFGLLSAHTPQLGLPFGVENSLLPLSMWVIAVITMSFGNLLAIIQDNLKRLMAYSGIAHTGYMLIGVLVASATPGEGVARSGMDAVLFYLAAYGLMTVGVFAVISHVENPDRPVESVDDLAGLGRTHPWAAAAMAVFLFSLIGLPLTAGFVGKFNLFVAAFEVPTDTKMRNMYQILTVVAVVNAAISAVYYLRALGVMFLRAPLKPATPGRGLPQLAVAVVCALATVVFGCWPQPLLALTSKAAPVPTPAPIAYVTSTK